MNNNLIKKIMSNDVGVLLLLGLGRFLLQVFLNEGYGFHRDELALLEDARHLAWGSVAYPPITPFIAWLGLTIFGPSLTGLRLFSVLAASASMVFSGLIAGRLGGNRLAQVVSALAVGFCPGSLVIGLNLMYVSFDYLFWVLTAYSVISLLKSEDPRWWLAIGTAIGLGFMNKYTMGFLVLGLVGGTLVTPARRYLKSPYLWLGAAISVVIFLPNLIWQVQNDFVSLDFLASIHARDVRIGRADNFFPEQILINLLNPLTLILFFVGLFYYFFSPDGIKFRLIGWMFVIPLVLFVVSRGRSYYLAPAYPMVIAAGADLSERWLAGLPEKKAGVLRKVTVTVLLVGAGIFILITQRLGPVNSLLWEITSGINGELKEEIGWPEMVKEINRIYQTIPAKEKPVTGILAGNYGEAGAINLYGPQYGLPRAISLVNTFWLLGYGDPPPQTVIIVGYNQSDVESVFKRCELAGHVTNEFGVLNEETSSHPDIFICRDIMIPWSELWAKYRYFG